MQVVPHCIQRFRSRREIYQFLLSCRQNSVGKGYPKLLSVSFPIDAVDPLAVLHELASSDPTHFYFERHSSGEAIASIGIAHSFTSNQRDRFSSAQVCIQSWLEQIQSICPNGLSAAPLTVCCSFTFFSDSPVEANSPFPSAHVWIPRWQVSKSHDRYWLMANLTLDHGSDLEELAEEVWQTLHQISTIQYHAIPFPHTSPLGLTPLELADLQNFGDRVRLALRSIQQQQLEKIVLAHAIDVMSPLPFQPLFALDNLRHLYPDCYIFSIGSRGHSFIGASPERLLSIRDRHLTTDALAGSAPRGKTVRDDIHFARQLLNSPKEQREHRFVVDFMADQLTQLGLKPQFSHRPTLRRLSNIQHLHTQIQTAIPATLQPLQVLAALHPTPAVAGIPRAIACNHIRRYEPFERSLYAAPIGWLDAQGNAEFIVGIRSALIAGRQARLYAGAGIVDGSDPERELAEIRLKFQALLQALA